MVRYSEQELATAWREEHGIAQMPGSTGGVGETQMEALIRRRLRCWYAKLLYTVPYERAPIRDLKESVKEGWYTSQGALMLRLPAEGCRLVEVMLPEWDKPVRVFHEPGSPAALRQLDRWRRSDERDPVVIMHRDTLMIYGLRAEDAVAASEQMRVAPAIGNRLSRLLMTAWPENGDYEFDIQDFPDDNFE